MWGIRRWQKQRRVGALDMLYCIDVRDILRDLRRVDCLNALSQHDLCVTRRFGRTRGSAGNAWPLRQEAMGHRSENACKS